VKEYAMSKKKQVLKDLVKEMRKSKGEKLMEKMPPMRVSIAGDSPEAIKEGLKLAGEVLDKDPLDMMDKAEEFMKARMKKSKKDKKKEE
jgi:hypothetical protein